MICCDMSKTTLTVTKDDEDEPTLEELVCAIANSAEIDPIELENEGTPVYLGNDYAEYQVRILTQKGERVFGVGPKELWALLAYDTVRIEGMEL